MSLDFQFEQIAYWAQSFDTCCILHSGNSEDIYGKYDFIVAVGVVDELIGNKNSTVEQIDDFVNKQWSFGFLSYELKNNLIDKLHFEPKIDKLNFPLFYFFKPKFLLIKPRGGNLEIVVGDKQECISQIKKFTHLKSVKNSRISEIKCIMPKNQYIKKVETLQKHILRGDIYEVNFCQEFYADTVAIDTFELFMKLLTTSPMPFSSYFKWSGKSIICASPERFLVKDKQVLRAQPIKGTAPSSKVEAQNEQFKYDLYNSEKERSENVMIVDLMRNDFTKIGNPKSVKVEELFGIYTFAQVNQMISTIKCDLPSSITFSEIIKATFPMGSMTGAPKIRAINLIEAIEPSLRGVFSGSLGYINPDGDFDFNVVIRSIFHCEEERSLTFQVGSAITHLSNPALEFEECMLKAKAIIEVLQSYQTN